MVPSQNVTSYPPGILLFIWKCHWLYSCRLYRSQPLRNLGLETSLQRQRTSTYKLHFDIKVNKCWGNFGLIPLTFQFHVFSKKNPKLCLMQIEESSSSVYSQGQTKEVPLCFLQRLDLSGLLHILCVLSLRDCWVFFLHTLPFNISFLSNFTWNAPGNIGNMLQGSHLKYICCLFIKIANQ